MKYLKRFNESSEFTPEEIMKELTLGLLDAGLQVNVYHHTNHLSFHVEIKDNDKVFCKNYPKDDMDWLYSKPIIMNFFNELTDFGLIRDKDYKVYGGGLNVNLVFQIEGLNKIKI
jgi:hypothetical protein